MFTTFYNETIRKTVIGFGSLFDDIFVQRFDSSGNLQKRFCSSLIRTKREIYSNASRVPLLKGDGSDVHIGEVLPSMGFSITQH